MSSDTPFSSFDNISPSQHSPRPPRAPIIIFGSQGSDFLAGYDVILALSQHHPTLSAFLSSALDAIRDELQSVANRQATGPSGGTPISTEQREPQVELLALLPHIELFADLKTLVKHHRQTALKDPVINGVLLCLLHTASVVAIYCAAHHDEHEDDAAANVSATLKEAWKAISIPCSHLLGFCTGAFSAFSIRQLTEDRTAASPFNIWTYAQEAVKAIRICFWISLRSAQARQRLGDTIITATSFDHWSIVVAVKKADHVDKIYECLSRFNELEQMRPLDKTEPLSVTAKAVNQVSIGGSPRSLDRFKAYLVDILGRSCRVSPLEIFSPYHCPNLEPEAVLVLLDLERRGLVDDSVLPPSQKILWETAHANILSVPDMRGALSVLVDSNLCCTADWDAMVDRLIMLEGELPDAQPLGSGVVVTFGPGNTLASDLTKRLPSQHDMPSSAQAVQMIDVPSRLRDWLKLREDTGPRSSPHPHPDVDGEEVVIVSMACRFPGDVRTPEQLWTCLETGRSTVSEIPKYLFDINAYYGEGMNQTLARHMHALPENVIKSMDARLFSMSPKEIEQLDPQHRLVMLCSYEALERAGYSPEANSPSSFDGKRIAVCIGASWDDYRENASWNIGSYFITGNIRAFIPGHVSFSLKWEGPSVSLDSLECSAVSAIQWSRRALLSGQCDVALAGAVNVLTQPQMFIAMDKQGILSRSGTNATFSSNLDGKTRGDGCGVLLLKRRSTAIRDGDKILATVPAARSTYHGQDVACEEVSSNQSKFLAQVLSEAGIRPSDLVHIEASGFHTLEGEAAEFDSLARLLASDRNSSGSDGISVASSRPNIGAGEAVSAMASVMKAVLMLEKGSVPRQISIPDPSELQPSIASICANSPLFVPTQAQLLPSSKTKKDRRGILVNSLASTGCHGAVVVGAPMLAVEEAVSSGESAATAFRGEKRAWVFALSAKNKESGEMLKRSLIDYLQREVCLADLSYSLLCRRTHYPFRLVAVASEQDELIRCLRGSDFSEAKQLADLPGLGFFFGVPHPVNMDSIKRFFDLTSSLRDPYEEVCSFIEQFQTLGEKQDVMLMQICLTWLLEDCGIRPSIVTGNAIHMLHSGQRMDRQLAIRALKDPRLLKNVNLERDFDDARSVDTLISWAPTRPPRVAAANDLANKRSAMLDAAPNGDAGAQNGLPANYQWIEFRASLMFRADDSPEQRESLRTADAQRLHRDFLSVLGQLHQQGYAISWIEFFRPHLCQLRFIETLPTYPFHLQQYWMEYHDRSLLQPKASAHKKSPDARSASEAADGSISDVNKELLTQPLLTALEEANSGWRLYVSDLTDEAQAVLVKASSLSAALIELMLEAAKEATDSSVTEGKIKPDGDSLCLSNVRLGEAGALQQVDRILLSVHFDNADQDPSTGRVEVLDGGGDCIGACSYQWLDTASLRWSKLSPLLERKIDYLMQEGERLDAKLIYKGIHGDISKSTRSIEEGFLIKDDPFSVVYSDEVLFWNELRLPNVEEHCVLPALLSTLEECARWYINDSHSEAVGSCEHAIVSIGKFVFADSLLKRLKVYGQSGRDFVADPSEEDSMILPYGMFRVFIAPTPNAGLFEVDMVIINVAMRIVGELERVQLAKVDSPSKHPSTTATTSSAPPAAIESKPKSATAQVSSQTLPNPGAIASAPVQKKPSSHAAEVHSKIITVLASELGFTVEEMKPSVKFADLGLDSLMSLVCISTLESLNLGFEIPQSLFMERDSPGELLDWIREQVGDAAVDLDDHDEAMADRTQSTDAADDGVAAVSTTLTPAQSPEINRPQQETQSAPQGSAAVEDAMKTITSTIETELGVAEGSINQDANLADLGMDSLMSLLVLGNLASMLSFELPSSLFMDHLTLREIRAFVAGQLGDVTQPAPARDHPVNAPSGTANPAFFAPPAKKPVLLQKASTPEGERATPLFLLPDGSGMSTVYQSFPAIDRPLYSINSPFLSDASAWNGGIAQIAHYYLASMKLVQPEGPWLVGGWSFGGIAAFEIACSLATSAGGKANDRIAGLFLLDSPCPVRYPPLPMSIVDWIFTAPEIKDIAPPALSDKLLAHFKATVDSMVGWHPTSMSRGNAYKVLACGDASKVPLVWYVVADHPLPGKMEDIKEVNETVKWLFRHNRAQNYGSDGWEAYIPHDKMIITPITSANHFTLVREPNLGEVANVLQEACRSALQS